MHKQQERGRYTVEWAEEGSKEELDASLGHLKINLLAGLSPNFY